MANPELVEDGEEHIVDLLVASDAKYVNSGTGVTGPTKGDTDTETETAEARDTGAQSEYNAQTYQVIATHTYAGTFAITECTLHTHVSAGVLVIRGTFSAINVENGDQIQFTIRLEIQ